MSIERQAVRNDVVEPNLALLYPCEEFVDVFLRGRLTESQRDSLVEDLAERKVIVRHSINADHGDDTSSPNGADGCLSLMLPA